MLFFTYLRVAAAFVYAFGRRRKRELELLHVRGWRRLDQDGEPDGLVERQHLGGEALRVGACEVGVGLVVEGGVQVGEGVAERVAHRVQVEVVVEADGPPNLEERCPALLDGLGVGHFVVVEALERVVVQRRVGGGGSEGVAVGPHAVGVRVIRVLELRVPRSRAMTRGVQRGVDDHAAFEGPGLHRRLAELDEAVGDDAGADLGPVDVRREEHLGVPLRHGLRGDDHDRQLLQARARARRRGQLHERVGAADRLPRHARQAAHLERHRGLRGAGGCAQVLARPSACSRRAPLR